MAKATWLCQNDTHGPHSATAMVYTCSLHHRAARLQRVSSWEAAVDCQALHAVQRVVLAAASGLYAAVQLPDEGSDLQQATMLALLLELAAAEVPQAAGTRLQQIPAPTSQHSLRPMALELSTEPDTAIPQC